MSSSDALEVVCAVCGLAIRRAAEADRPWIHVDPAYNPWAWPIHAPEPTEGDQP